MIKIIKKGNKIVEVPILPKVNPKILKKGVAGKFSKIEIYKKGKKLVPTLRQEKVIAEVGKGMTNKGAILRKAGYADSLARNPKKVFDKPVVAEAVKDTVIKMRKIRDKFLNEIDKKPIEKEKAYNLVVMASILTKDSELLDGKPTSREEYTLTDEEKKKLDELLEMNS